MRRGSQLLILLLAGVSCRNFGQAYEPRLWKLSSGSSTVYLLGSIHAGTAAMYPMAKPIEDAFAASSVLLVESDTRPSAGSQEALAAFLQQAEYYPPGDSLWNHISKRTRRRLLDFYQRNRQNPFVQQNLQPQEVARVRPWAAALVVDAGSAMSRGMDYELGVDKHFIDEAERAGKRIVAIESLEFQIRLVAGFSEKLQVKSLESSLGMKVRGMEEIDKAIVADRNVHMADVAEQYLKGSAQAFLVVGSAHVGGAQGVVRLIELRGYRVEEAPVSN